MTPKIIRNPLTLAALCWPLFAATAAQAENATAFSTGQICGETFDTVEAAHEKIRTRDGVEFNGSNTEYIAFASEEEQKIWTFTTNKSHAHPSVVCRQVVYVDDTVSIRTTALCEAEQADCEWLLGQFEALNEDVRKQMEQEREKAREE